MGNRRILLNPGATIPLRKAYQMSLVSAGSISLDSTFKFFHTHSKRVPTQTVVLGYTVYTLCLITFTQGFTKRCRLSWLTNSALVYEPKSGGEGELRGLSQWVQLYTGAQINFRDQTPYLTYAFTEHTVLPRKLTNASIHSSRQPHCHN